MNSETSDTLQKPVIVLFREDLRLADNQALSAAAATGRLVIPVFIFDTESAAGQHGAAWRWWLHHSLAALAASLRAMGGLLVMRSGPHRAVVDALIAETGADTVHWNRRYHPDAMACDAALKAGLRKRGINAHSHGGHLLHEPSLLKTGSGGPFKVFTPFWNAMLTLDDFGAPLPAPATLRFADPVPDSEELASWGLLPESPDWSTPLADAWTPGEAEASARLEDFIEEDVTGYVGRRDFPADPATSRLSPHLAHGEISPRMIWHRVRRSTRAGQTSDAAGFLRELAWREFSYHLLVHNDALGTHNADPKFDAMAWRDDPAALRAWQRGRTGIPIVDAGMRQLWQTGWMHNRVRMICASYLVKHMLIDWRAGERWFADTLVDADPANNAASWQWVAGTSPHGAPFFRIFNPVLQSRKFDAEGSYIRDHVPELAALGDKAIHEPWTAPSAVLDEAGLAENSPYRRPVVGPAAGRARALAAFKALSGE